MLKRLSLVLALAGLALLGTTLANAKSKHLTHKQRFTAVAKLTVVSHTRRYPAPRSSAVLAGVEQAGNETGTVVQTETILAHRKASSYTFKGSGTHVYTGGALTSRFTGTATVKSDGSVTVKGSGRLSGSSGSLRGVTGTYKFKGSLPGAAPAACTVHVLTVQMTGTIRY